MGSDGKRRTKDRVRIDKPLSKETGVGGNSGGGGGGGGNVPIPDINNICPPAFKVRLANQSVKANTSLVLVGKTLKLALPPELEVGRLTAKQTKTIETCSGLGISYDTVRVVVDKEGVRYAELSQQ